MSLVELFELFPDDTTAEAWFELQRWGKQICCPRCGSVRYSKVKNRRPAETLALGPAPEGLSVQRGCGGEQQGGQQY